MTLNRRHALQAAAGLAAIFTGLSPARAEGLLRGEVTQGALLRGRTDPRAEVVFDGKRLRLSAEGHFALGFAWDRTTPARLAVRVPGAEPLEQDLTPTTREYRIQRIDGLPDKYVDPPPEVLERIARDNALIDAARSRDTEVTWFADAFAWPVKGPITGVFGSQRILNGAPRRPHFGLDIAAGEGKPIASPVGAIVAMAEPDLYFTGGTVILDHGHGVSSSYLHMSRIDVKVGDRVGQGDVIGAIGKTGRATGPHLCWRLNWFKERLDPALVVPKA